MPRAFNFHACVHCGEIFETPGARREHEATCAWARDLSSRDLRACTSCSAHSKGVVGHYCATKKTRISKPETHCLWWFPCLKSRQPSTPEAVA